MRKGMLAAAVVLSLGGCSLQRKLDRIQKDSIGPKLTMTERDEIPDIEKKELRRDTLSVKDSSGKEILIMRAVKDENGEMVANDVIKAAVVTARFRNVAERHGKIDLMFDVTVPKEMQDSRWQLRFHPEMTMGDETVGMEPILVTGDLYRRAQLKGYEQYEKFLKSIVSDSSRFVDAGQLEIFLRRNIPEIYKFKEDSSYVTDEQFSSAFGVTRAEALEHYTNSALVRRNRRKVASKDRMFSKYVKVPLMSEGLRLDTVMRNPANDIVYRYVQTISAGRKIRKAEITMEGGIYEEDEKIYSIDRSEPLTFYISSLSSLTDDTEKYVTAIVSRRAEANSACYIEFSAGRSEIDPGLGNNRSEIGRIKGNLRSLLQNETFDMDSITVTASCSPEGSYEFNRRLSASRSSQVCSFFKAYARSCSDSLRKAEGKVYDLEKAYKGALTEKDISFRPKSDPENWTGLDAMVKRDSVLSDDEKSRYFSLRDSGNSLDAVEASLQKTGFYPYLRSKVYPYLRIVKFDFHLHRKGMVKDTVHTTQLDTVYMKGVQAIRDRDYETAVRVLRPYGDLNLAVAYLALDYNNSALSILDKLKPSDKSEYLLAIAYSRLGDDNSAVQHYLNACGKNRSFISRGNLDPEVSSLISKYSLNKQ